MGNPNVGKSTLMNLFVGERISIATFKAQTTRHRIMGIINDDEAQIVFSTRTVQSGFLFLPAAPETTSLFTIPPSSVRTRMRISMAKLQFSI